MIIYRVTRKYDDGSSVNYPCGFCTQCGRNIGNRFIPDWILCPWCGHRFKRRHQEITYDELMKMVGKAQEET